MDIVIVVISGGLAAVIYFLFDNARERRKNG